ncbi:MAG: hypothetical protein M3506_06995 [Chloroflexota bacterium]|nr:hypothetical protein [Chloroflexota bacterium]
MGLLFEWVGAVVLLGLLLLLVPVFFMLIITLQFWLSGRGSVPVSGDAAKRPDPTPQGRDAS